MGSDRTEPNFLPLIAAMRHTHFAYGLGSWAKLRINLDHKRNKVSELSAVSLANSLIVAFYDIFIQFFHIFCLER